MDFTVLGKKLFHSLLVLVFMFLYHSLEGSSINSPLPGWVGSVAIHLALVGFSSSGVMCSGTRSDQGPGHYRNILALCDGLIFSSQDLALDFTTVSVILRAVVSLKHKADWWLLLYYICLHYTFQKN